MWVIEICTSTTMIDLQIFDKIICYWLMTMWHGWVGVTSRPTFWQIYQRKATGKYSGVPYIATLLNCLMWTFYGSGSVANLMLVLTINVAGVIIESLYIGIHLFYGDQKSRVRYWIHLPFLLSLKRWYYITLLP